MTASSWRRGVRGAKPGCTREEEEEEEDARPPDAALLERPGKIRLGDFGALVLFVLARAGAASGNAEDADDDEEEEEEEEEEDVLLLPDA